MGHRSCLDVAIDAGLPAHRSSLYVIYPICMKMVAVNLIYIYISSMVYQDINIRKKLNKYSIIKK